MSKPESPIKSRSKSRSRSRSYSRSHSRSRSRSRSRKRRYSSRSRSRSYSPSYRNYPSRDYQNNRGGYNRGYNRGYRRPFHYRGRNRGYHHRGGHYQNRGGGYGYKSNWQGGGWHDKDHSPRRGRSRSRSRKRSGSRSRSRYSDRSSSRGSRRSRRSRSYSSRSRSSSHHRKGKTVKDHKKPAESPGAKPGPEGSAIEKASGGKWIDYETSPKPSSPDRAQAAAKKEDSGVENKGPGSGGPMWRTIGSVSPPKPSPPAAAQTAAFGGFGFFSKEEASPSDKAGISAAFKKFLAENKGKKEEDAADVDKAKGDLYSSFSEKDDKELPFFDAGEEEFLKAHVLKDDEEEGGVKSSISARELFGKWGDEPAYPTAYPIKDKARRDPDEPEGAPEEEPYRRKHKKEEKKKKEKKEKRRSPSPREKERPLFPGAFPARADSPPRLAASREEFEQKVSSMGLDELPRDVIPSKKDAEFRSIFQHIQGSRRSPSELFAQHLVSIVHYIKAQHFPSADMSLSERFALYQKKAEEAELMKPRKSPEIHRRIDVSPSAFKRHSSLFEEVEESGFKETGKKFKGDVMDLRLDIERRKRLSGKGRSPGGSRERSSEKAGKHHKKSKKAKKKRDRSPSSSSSSSSPSPYPPPYRGKEYSEGPMEHPEEGYPHQRYPPHGYGPGDNRGPREYEGHGMDRGRGRGFFPRVRGRGWNRGNYQGNSSNGNPANMNPQQRPPEEEWDPEYTPKSRKYYLHDDRDGEKTWVDNRGRGRGAFPNRRGRFVYRKGGAGGTSPKWTHDMYQGGEEGEIHDEGCDDKGPGDSKP
ncbi:thyroid hormone receptor-associated protein 3b isoform X2 [Boleophthalmus pectinirostris]|uniref:thyroid hormone receptor-associated protein 3b isoform X2 n=1 Tax=Boleophthalmus pectinirostris TaxID=150288 RepID=UPI00242B0EE1|nr:thyroid hormone receptor-associated protein 3b isoform X2 [Boleophthalmus pectinirostris]